jgi:uncharacterized protein involved in exopolysaccharide biosynthesis
VTSATDIQGGPATDPVTLTRVASAALRHRRLLLVWTIGAALVVSAVTLLLPRTYTSTSSFIPQARRSQGNLSGIASQLGIPIPGLTEGGDSPQLYVSLLKSRQLMGAVVDSRFATRGPSDTGRVLMNILRPRGGADGLRREDAIDKLAELTSVRAEPKIAMVQLSVKLKDPVLARDVNLRYLALVNEFNLRTRQSQASEERKFSGLRVEDLRQALRESEDRLQQFLQQNRDYRNSPLLTFQQERLARAVSQQQTLYTALRQSYEQAKMDEVRDTPVITVVEQPLLPARPDRRNLLAKVLLGALLGGLVGAVIAAAHETWAQSLSVDPVAAGEFARSRQELRDDVRRVMGGVRRMLGAGR